MKVVSKEPRPLLHRRAARALLPALKEKVSGGIIAGLFFVLTGFGPEEWFRRLFESLRLPEYVAGSLKSFDPRLGLVGIGVILIGVDIILRHYRHQARIETASSPEGSTTQSGATLQTTNDTNAGGRPKGLPLPDKPSIAVLPFQNVSGDSEQEYFADGIVDDLITALSRFKSLFVIARNSSFTYKNKAVDIRQVGRELGVRYVLEGSVRRTGARVRITGQLVDAATGAHLWADKIDGALEDIFKLQDEVTIHVVGAIAPSILEAEIARTRAKPTESIDAYDLYLRALATHYPQTRAAIDQALTLLERAVALDPSYSWAKAFLAYIYCLKSNQSWGKSEDIGRGRMLAREALAENRDDPETIGYAAHAIAWLARDYDTGLAAMDRALHLNPNSFDIVVRAGWMRIWVGDAERAAVHFHDCLRLNPIDPMLGYVLSGCAYVHILKGEYDKALPYARRSAHEMAGWIASWVALAVCAGHLGLPDEAKLAKQRLLELAPDFSIARFREWTPLRETENRDTGLQLAGMPVQ